MLVIYLSLNNSILPPARKKCLNRFEELSRITKVTISSARKAIISKMALDIIEKFSQFIGSCIYSSSNLTSVADTANNSSRTISTIFPNIRLFSGWCRNQLLLIPKLQDCLLF